MKMPIIRCPFDSEFGDQCLINNLRAGLIDM
jgi:hypothetical protein